MKIAQIIIIFVNKSELFTGSLELIPKININISLIFKIKVLN